MRGRRPGKNEVYSLEYIEDFSGRERRRWPQIVRRSRSVERLLSDSLLDLCPSDRHRYTREDSLKRS